MLVTVAGSGCNPAETAEAPEHRRHPATVVKLHNSNSMGALLKGDSPAYLNPCCIR